MNYLKTLGIVSIAIFSFWPGVNAFATPWQCGYAWDDSKAAQSCGKNAYPYSTVTIDYNASDDTCRIQAICKPRSCQQDKTVKLNKVSQLNNCNCSLKVGNC